MKNLERLKEVLSIESETYDVKRMVDFIRNRANELGANIITVENNNIYITKGQPSDHGYHCIVAHTDTVHKILKTGKLKVCQLDDDHLIGFDENSKSLAGIGGDDKVGIYIALSMLEEMDSIKVAFFRDEEVGCIGSKEADMSFFDDVMYVLQCDRKGNSDFVNKISNKELQSKIFMEDVTPVISAHNYKFSNGGTTDVEALYVKGLKVSSANMSCGYYNPHSDDEIVCVSDVFRCEEMVYDIFCTLLQRYPIEVYKPFVTSYVPRTTKYNYPKNNKIKKHNLYNNQLNISNNLDWYGNPKKKRNMKPAVADDSTIIYSKNNVFDDVDDEIDSRFKKHLEMYNKSNKHKCWDCGKDHDSDNMGEHGLCIICYAEHSRGILY
jgi:predicted site-specific integrase-resolvase